MARFIQERTANLIRRATLPVIMACLVFGLLPYDSLAASKDTVYNGVDYSAVYSYDYYHAKYADLRRAYGTNRQKYIRHFVLYGMKEGRQAKADFVVLYYRNRYADLRKAYGNNLMKYYVHYIRYGRKEGRFTNATAEAKWRSGRKFLMIGDSNSQLHYPGRDNSVAWPEFVMQCLGLSQSQVSWFREGGYGFASPGKRFADALSGFAADTSMTDILIVGGAGNDRKCSRADIAQGFRDFCTVASRKFPNARIMYAIPNWSLRNTTYQSQVSANIPYYKQLCTQYGVVYLSGLESVLKGHPEYFFSDQMHWNYAGQKAVSQVLISKIMLLDKNKYGV